MPLTQNPSDKYVAALAQLMQNYRSGSAVSGQCQIVPIQDPSTSRNGLASIGTDGHVYLIMPDSSSDTGWTCTNTQCPLPNVKSVGGSGSASGVMLIATDGESLQQYSSGTWQALTPPSSVTLNGVAELRTTIIPGSNQCLIGVKDAGSAAIYLISENWAQAVQAGGSSTIDWCPAIVLYVEGQSSTPNPGVFMTYVGQGGDQLICAFAAINGGEPAGGQLTGNYTAIGTGFIDPWSNPWVLCTDDLAIYMLYGNGPGNPYFASNKVSGEFAMTALAVSATAKDVQVFGLSTDRHLYYTQMNQETTAILPIFCLNPTIQFASIAAAPNTGGTTELFGVTTSNELYRVWQEQPGSSVWNFEEIDVSNEQSSVAGVSPRIIEEYDSYNIQLTVFDSQQVQAPGVAVTIYTAEPVTLEINGATRFLAPGAPCVATTNVAGQITLTAKTQTLAVPPVSISTPAMPSGDRIELHASGPTMKALGGLTAETLAQQQVQHPDGAPTSLIDAHFTADSVLMENLAQAVSSTMKLAERQDAVSTGEAFHSFRQPSDPTVARYVRAGERPLRPSEPLNEQFMVDFSGTTPVVFTPLTPAQADEFIRACQSPVDGLKLFGVDWGEVWDEVKDGVARVVKFVVKTVSDGVHVAFELVISGVKYAWDTVIEYGKAFIQRALDLAQEIFARVKVGWEKLMGWLGFIFNWGDMKRTHQAVAHSINAVLVAFEDGLEAIRAKVDTALEGFQDWVKDHLESAIQQFSGVNDTLIQYQNSVDRPNEQAERMATTNVMYNGFLNNVGQAGPTMFGALEAEDEFTLRQLLHRLEQFVADNKGAEAFANAINYFEKAVSTPDQFLNLVVSGVLSAVEGAAQLLIQAAQTVIDIVFDIVEALARLTRKALNAAWSIPFVSDLYKRVTGGELTAVDLVAMIVAIPGTIFYKLAAGAAPFPTESDVEAFKGQFTGPALLSAMGLTPSDAAVRGAEAFPPPLLLQTMNALNAASLFVYSSMTAYNDASLPASSPNEAFVKANYIAELAVLATGALGQISTQGIDCPGAVSNFLLIVQGASVFIDGLFIKLSKKFPANVNDAGVWVAFGMGAVAGILTFTEAIWVKLPGPVVATNFLTTFPSLCKLLRFKEVIEYSEPPGASLIALGLLDILFYQTGALVIIATLNDSTTPPAIETA